MSQRQIGVLVFLVALFSGLSARVVAAPVQGNFLTPGENPAILRDGGNRLEPLPDRESKKLVFMTRVNEIKRAVQSKMASAGAKSAPIDRFGPPGREVFRFSISGYTVMETKFEAETEGSNILGEAFFYHSPTGYGIEFSAPSGRMGLYMGINTLRVVIHDGVPGPFIVQSMDAFLYQQVEGTLVTTTSQVDLRDNSIDRVKALKDFTSMVERLAGTSVAWYDLTDFVDSILPVFAERLQATRPAAFAKMASALDGALCGTALAFAASACSPLDSGIGCAAAIGTAAGACRNNFNDLQSFLDEVNRELGRRLASALDPYINGMIDDMMCKGVPGGCPNRGTEGSGGSSGGDVTCFLYDILDNGDLVILCVPKPQTDVSIHP